MYLVLNLHRTEELVQNRTHSPAQLVSDLVEVLNVFRVEARHVAEPSEPAPHSGIIPSSSLRTGQGCGRRSASCRGFRTEPAGTGVRVRAARFGAAEPGSQWTVRVSPKRAGQNLQPRGVTSRLPVLTCPNASPEPQTTPEPNQTTRAELGTVWVLVYPPPSSEPT